MHDAGGQLTQEENEKVAEWFRDHWKLQTMCPVSGDNNWQIGDRVVDLVSHQGAFRPTSYPKVPVMCMTCGYTLLFNAVVMGIVEEVEGVSDG